MNKKISLEKIKEPQIFEGIAPVFLSNETMTERKNKLLQAMSTENFDTLIIYADKEHGGNFEYLTGFIPRFEEALLVLEKTGEATLILGNENLKMSKVSRLANDLIHTPLFSLANQPMENERALADIFKDLGLAHKNKIGVVGWKMFTTAHSDPKMYFDLPYFMMQALMVCCQERVIIQNAIHLLIGGVKGVRTVNNANELAHYEYGANLSSNCILAAMNAVSVGITEAELGKLLTAEGQTNSVVTIAATGQRFEFANVYPTHKAVKLGDPLSLTTGYKGGLSSRTGFVVENENQLPVNQNDYLERIVKPYYNTIVTWLETIEIGMSGQEIYKNIEAVFPKKSYGWHLNPGHLVADEEWMSSPIYPNSKEKLKSGMILQIDIIPSVTGYTGTSAEECVALADKDLQQQIEIKYPKMWQRIQDRKEYLQRELGIQLSEDVLPLSNTVAYLRPFYLAKEYALCAL